MSFFSQSCQFLFPAYCMWCNKVWSYLCVKCKQSLDVHPESCPWCHRYASHFHVCETCQSEYWPLQWVLIWFQYSWLLKKLVLKLKYYHIRAIADYFAKKLSYHILAHPQLSKAYHDRKLIITYTPSHRWRKHMVKGYNQSELLARHLWQILDTPVFTKIWKQKRTQSQTELSRQQRLSNLENAFISQSSPLLLNKTILIVDDITTTWSTIREAARVIQRVNPTSSFRWVVVWRHGR